MNQHPWNWTVSSAGPDLIIVAHARIRRRFWIHNQGPGTVLPIGKLGPLSDPIPANASVHFESERLTVHNLGPGPARGSFAVAAMTAGAV
jgi:hypothetical protein